MLASSDGPQTPSLLHFDDSNANPLAPGAHNMDHTVTLPELGDDAPDKAQLSFFYA